MTHNNSKSAKFRQLSLTTLALLFFCEVALVWADDIHVTDLEVEVTISDEESRLAALEEVAQCFEDRAQAPDNDDVEDDNPPAQTCGDGGVCWSSGWKKKKLPKDSGSASFPYDCGDKASKSEAAGKVMKFLGYTTKDLCYSLGCDNECTIAGIRSGNDDRVELQHTTTGWVDRCYYYARFTGGGEARIEATSCSCP